MWVSFEVFKAPSSDFAFLDVDDYFVDDDSLEKMYDFASNNELNAVTSNLSQDKSTSSFKSFSHSMTLDNPINNTLDIYNNIIILLNKIDLSEKIRSIGIRLGDLKNKNLEQVSFFNNKNDDNIQDLLDNINAKYQNTVVMPAIFYEKDK